MDADRSSASAASSARGAHAIVRTAWRFLLVLRAIECALVGASAGALTLAAGIFSGTAADANALRVASAIAAVLAALSWWLENEPGVDATARRIDRREKFGGELVTAFEVERKHGSRDGRAVESHAANEIERALGERVAARLTLARCLRAIAPASAVLLAAPLAGAAVLFAAIDRAHQVERASADAANADAAAFGADGAIGSLAAHARDLRGAAASSAAEDASAMRALADDAERIQKRVASKTLTPAAAASELARAIERARMITERAGASADREHAAAVDEVRRAQRALESARAELERRASSDSRPELERNASSDSRPELERNASSDSRPQPAPVAEPSRNAGETAATQDSAPTRRDASAHDDRSTGASEERGASGGRWWPERYDAIVERWVEMQRAGASPEKQRR